MIPERITIQLPDWVSPFVTSREHNFSSVVHRMQFVLSLAKESIARKSGGPFAAAVFDSSSNTLIAAGINLVVSQCCSSAHAEIVALTLAQQHSQRFDLSDGGKHQYELVTSTEPCAMCLGAIPWSGITTLVCGARDEDARHIGFDEGAKVSNWIERLNANGISVSVDICRKEATEILALYASQDGIIYNSK